MSLLRDLALFLFMGFMALFPLWPALSDEQFANAIRLLFPLHLLMIFLLCVVFYLRATYFAIYSCNGPRGTLPMNSITYRKVAALVVFIFTLILATFGMGEWTVGGEYVSVEDNVSFEGMAESEWAEYAHPIVVECEYNEECVTAKMLQNSSFGGFLSEDTLFEPGEIDDYNDPNNGFGFLFLTIYCWPCILFFLGLYDYANGKKPTGRSKPEEWRKYYDKKSYHSYGFIVLLLFALPLPMIFINWEFNARFFYSGFGTMLGTMLVAWLAIIIYYLFLYFYSYDKNDACHFDLPLSTSLTPVRGMSIISVVGFLIALFAAPVGNVNNIWLSDWIFRWGGEIGLFDSESYRHSIANLVIPSFLVGVFLAGTTAFFADVWGKSGGKFLFGMTLLFGLASLGASGLLLLGIYGWIAMIFIELVSFNHFWLAPVMMLSSSLLVIRVGSTLDGIAAGNLNPPQRTARPVMQPVTPAPIPVIQPYPQRRSLADQSSLAPVPPPPVPQMLAAVTPIFPRYSSGDGYGVEISVPNPHTGEYLTVMLGPIKPNSGWNSSITFWDAFTKRELIMILKLFGQKLGGNKATVISRCRYLIPLAPQELWRTSDVLFNPKTLVERIAKDAAGAKAVGDVGTKNLNPDTELLGSEVNKVMSTPQRVSEDSKGIITIETGFSVVTLNKLTDEVTKVPRGPEQYEMFYQEIKNMEYLDEKGFDVGLIGYDDGSNPKIVTRYMGPSKLSEQYQTLSKRGKKNLIIDLVNQVAQIHKCGMVHRDLKPDNILIDARPRNGNHQFDAIIDFGIAMKINRKPSEGLNNGGTKFFGHSSQKDVNFNASTGHDWFSLARIFTLILRGVSIDSLDAEIQMSLTGLDMRNEIQTLGFNDKVVDSMTELIIQSTKSSCEQHETVGVLARIGKEIAKSL